MTIQVITYVDVNDQEHHFCDSGIFYGNGVVSLNCPHGQGNNFCALFKSKLLCQESKILRCAECKRAEKILDQMMD